MTGIPRKGNAPNSVSFRSAVSYVYVQMHDIRVCIDVKVRTHSSMHVHICMCVYMCIELFIYTHIHYISLHVQALCQETHIFTYSAHTVVCVSTYASMYCAFSSIRIYYTCIYVFMALILQVSPRLIRLQERQSPVSASPSVGWRRRPGSLRPSSRRSCAVSWTRSRLPQKGAKRAW